MNLDSGNNLTINIIIGKAGTGKTNYIKESIKRKPVSNLFICTAFTHSAVNNIRDRLSDLTSDSLIKFKTLHSLFRISRDNIPIGILGKDDFDYLYVDEFSLIDKNLFEKCILSLHKLSIKKRTIFIIGDILQLGSISNIYSENIISKSLLENFMTKLNNTIITNNYSTKSIVDIIFHLSRLPIYSELVEKYTENTVVLTKNYRQYDSTNLNNFINNLFFDTKEDNNNNAISQVIDNIIDMDTVVKYIRENNYVFIGSSYDLLYKINEQVRITDKNVKIMDFSNKNNKKSNRLYLIPNETVYMMENSQDDQQLLYHNGEVVIFTDSTEDVVLLRKCDKNEEFYANVQIIMPTYLYTFHKCQGLEFNNVIVCIDNLFAFPMLYTGMTRARKNIKFYTKCNGLSKETLIELFSNAGINEINVIDKVFYQ